MRNNHNALLRILSVILYALLLGPLNGQERLPTDFLSKEFHAARREAFRKLMPENSVAVIFSYPERVFSNDVNYVYHPNPDLYYLSGYKEPDAMLIIFKEMQKKGDLGYNEIMYARRRNPAQEVWDGRRLGVEGVKNQLGFNVVFNSDEFAKIPVDFSGFSKVLYDEIPDDIGASTLLKTIKTFMETAKVKQSQSRSTMQVYNIIANYTTPSNLANRVSRIKSMMAETSDEEFKYDPLILELLNKPDSATLSSVSQKINANPFPTQQYNTIISSLREIKTPEELALLRKSVFISSVAHAEVMKAIKPDMSEMELAGLHEYVHKKYGAEWEGYPPIVGAGANGCILHYEENNMTQVKNQLVLMDVGSEYHGYSADVTRTVPANGKFTAEQKAIYQLVYDAQEEVFKICREGTPWNQLNEKATEVLAEGLIKLGIIKDKGEVRRYYMHGVSHHMGLDVHDKNISRSLKENMVITVEPGIYIPKGSPCDPKWWDIGVRIEDDVVIGKNGFENLSLAAPRKAEEIEKLALKKSVFNDLNLPKLQ
jgi:Xaa-Pro aminopeptidase